MSYVPLSYTDALCSRNANLYLIVITLWTYLADDKVTIFFLLLLICPRKQDLAFQADVNAIQMSTHKIQSNLNSSNTFYILYVLYV